MEIIQEMRMALTDDNRANRQAPLPSSMPDWAVRRMFETRRGLPLSALPIGIRVRTAAEIRSFIAGPQKKVPVTPATTVTDAERARMKRMLEVAAL